MNILSIFENSGKIRNNKIFAITTACLLVFVATRADAGIISDINGNATQVTDVDVNGINYDVTFSVGSFDDVYGSGFPVSPEPLLNGASTAVVQAVRNEISDQLAGAGITAVSDQSGDPYYVFIVPFIYDSSTSTNSTFAGQYGSTDDNVIINGSSEWSGGYHSTQRNANGISTDFFGTSTAFTFARFTPSAVSVSVPEPNTLVLFGIAMVGLTRRSRK